MKNYQLKPDVLNDKGQVLYAEHYSNNNEDVLYTKYEYNSYGNRTYYEKGFVDGQPIYWIKYEYNDNEELIYWIDSDGEWAKWEYDGYKLVYYATSEDSSGHIDDLVNCEKCRLAKNTNVTKMYPSDSGDYICNSCLNDLYDYSAE